MSIAPLAPYWQGKTSKIFHVVSTRWRPLPGGSAIRVSLRCGIHEPDPANLCNSPRPSTSMCQRCARGLGKSRPVTRHGRYGWSTRRSSVVHLVHDVHLSWLDGQPLTGTANWLCSATPHYDDSRTFELSNEMPVNGTMCPICAHLEAIPQRFHRAEVVYVAEVDGMVKVGTTGDIARRMAALSGRLQALAFGSYDEEGLIVADLQGLQVEGREWFPMRTLPHALASLADRGADPWGPALFKGGEPA